MKAVKFIVFLMVVGFVSYGVWYKAVASKCPDTDLDGLNDCDEEFVYHTERFNPDTDGDGYTDGEEVEKGYSPHYGGGLRLNEVDSDRDGLMDAQEVQIGTSLMKADTDGDGISDFAEVSAKTDPLRVEGSDESGITKVKSFFE